MLDCRAGQGFGPTKLVQPRGSNRRQRSTSVDLAIPWHAESSNSVGHGCASAVTGLDLERDLKAAIESREHLHQPVEGDPPEIGIAIP